MSIVEIPVSNEPNKTYKVLLENQECTIKLYQKGKNIFLDLQVGAEQICYGAICLNLVPIVQVSSTAFSGNFVFVDILGDSAPQYEEIGTRYFLVYYSKDTEIPNIIKQDVGNGYAQF